MYLLVSALIFTSQKKNTHTHTHTEISYDVLVFQFMESVALGTTELRDGSGLSSVLRTDFF